MPKAATKKVSSKRAAKPSAKRAAKPTAKLAKPKENFMTKFLKQKEAEKKLAQEEHKGRGHIASGQDHFHNHARQGAFARTIGPRRRSAS